MQKIAVVGSGVTGLSCTWLLSKSKDHKVTLIESNDYFGGHAHTVSVNPLKDNGMDLESIGVDTGFIVCNDVTYPNFLNLLKQLDIPLINSDMSFAVSRNDGEFEWAGKSLFTVFCQSSNLYNWQMYKMLYEILKFNYQATKIATEADDLPLNQHPLAQMTLKEFFDRYGYSRFFYENYLLPMTAAIWSSPAETTFDKFPLVTLVQFMRNHCLLQISNRPVWKTIEGGSKRYVEKIIDTLDDVRLSCPVVSIKRTKDNVTLYFENGTHENFDKVVFCTHSDQTLNILGKEATKDERLILGGIGYVNNKAYLHRDETLMPKIKEAWSSWNYLTNIKNEALSNIMCLSYWMNNLQPYIDTSLYGTLIVTMNPLKPPKESTILGSWDYTHPLYSPETIKNQGLLENIQNKNNVVFAGAWTNYGFHEGIVEVDLDGCTSGLQAAERLGVKCLFEVMGHGGKHVTAGTLDKHSGLFHWLVYVGLVVIGLGILFSQ